MIVGEVMLAVGFDVELLLVVVTSSLQPNQPGVLQVEVDVVVVVVDVVVVAVVVVSSRHPHQPVCELAFFITIGKPKLRIG